LKTVDGCVVIAVSQQRQPLVQERVEDLVLLDLVLWIGAHLGGILSPAHIAERAESLDELERNVTRRRRAGRQRRLLGAELPLERRPQGTRARRLAAHHTAALPRLPADSVELRSRCQNEFPSSVANATEIAPAVVNARRQRLRKRGSFVEPSTVAARRGCEAAAGDGERAFRRRHAGQLQNR